MRLSTRDYSAPGLYFVTICATQKRCVFSQIKENTVQLTRLGEIVREVWLAIPSHFARVTLHAFVIMPNHFHGIVELAARLAKNGAQRQRTETSPSVVRPGSLSAIVRSFKAEVSRRGRQELNWQDRVWQPNYYDRVIRDGREFSSASQYILENRLMWRRDPENPSATAAITGKTRLAQHAARLQTSGPN